MIVLLGLYPSTINYQPSTINILQVGNTLGKQVAYNMFHCELCGKVSAPGVSPVRVVTQQREKVYEPRLKIHPPKGNSKEWRDDPGGKGQEIVGEMLCCSDCAHKVSAERGTLHTLMMEDR